MVALVVPASSERMLKKAKSLPVDEVVIDLEDAVSPERKTDALASTVAALADGPFAAGKVSVRVNPPRTRWCHSELIALASGVVRPHGIVVPKADTPGDLEFVERLLDGVEADSRRTDQRPIELHALLETVSGIKRASSIAASSRRLAALIIGYADLGVSLRRSAAGLADLDRWLPVQEQVLWAARDAGLSAINGPFLSIDDTAGLWAAARRAADLGFDGMWAIHPAQTSSIARAFTPSADEVRHAQAVIDALCVAESRGEGAVSLDGQMVDEPVRQAALRTLARAESAERSELS